MNNTIVKSFQRVEPDIIDGLAKAGSSTVCEAQGRENVLPWHIRPIYSGAAIAGSAVTISAPQGDNSMVHVAIEQLHDGDILVLAPPSPDTNAYFGELMAISAMAHGCRGLIIDAGVRDVRELTSMNFPVWAKSICSKGTDRKEVGSVNTPIVCAGIQINPGDIIVADDDGVCVVKSTDAHAVLERSQRREAQEEILRKRLAAGELGLDVFDMRDNLKSRGLKYEK